MMKLYPSFNTVKDVHVCMEQGRNIQMVSSSIFLTTKAGVSWHGGMKTI